MNVSLTPELEKFIAKQVDSGLYQTASEVVRAGLRSLKTQGRHPCEIPATLEELEADIQRSIDSLDRGEGIPGEEAFRRFKKKIKTRSRG